MKAPLALGPFFLAALLLAPLSAQRPHFPGGPGGPRGEAGEGGTGGPSKKKAGIQPYDKVIKKEFQHQRGLFLVHRGTVDGDEKVFYEIPVDAFGKDLLWVTQMEKTEAGFGYGGTSVGSRVVRWELRGEKVLLRDVKFSIRAEGEDSVRNSVEATSLAPIIQAFPVRAWGKDKAPVIDVTGLFTDDLPEFSAKRRLNASGVDKKRTFFDAVKVFPGNIETKVLMTYKLSSKPEPNRNPFSRGRRDPSQGAVTVLLHHSMVRLPGKPMQPRRFDDRVGYFSVSFEDYADTSEHQVEEVKYITRWRLEKKDPEAEVSEPVKPIVFYVGRGVPEKWRPWVKKGIEAWQPAFEAAGFKNAILAEDAPSPEEDPDWDAEDARYSSIRWLPSTIENAMGPHVSDPRTGEILEADILVFHNVIKLIRDWYFVQASPNDPRAQKLPLPDDLVGEALAYVVSHEVGHSLGFQHNMKASSAFSVEQLRDPEFTAKNGTEASIMDYGRFNYVAQPGDGARLIPIIGPYDFFAVEWGYKEFPGAAPEEEKAALEEIAKRQIDHPELRFGSPNPAEDPSQQTEDLGSDPIAATTLGLKNLSRVAGYLVKATCTEGKDYKLLRNMYEQVLGQRSRELGHVANLVGGFVRDNVWYGDGDRQYLPVQAEKQRQAVRFLNTNAFQAPRELLDPEILLRLESSGAADRILSSQKRLLESLVAPTRIKRMAEQDARSEGTYRPVEMLGDLREGIWSELDRDVVAIDLYRRNLQRAFIALMADRMKDEDAGSDLPALARGQLAALLSRVNAALPRAKDETTRLHLEEVKASIREALDPRLEKESAPPARPVSEAETDG